jgi:hypothetical protein
MARSTKRELKFDLRPAIEHLGLDFVLEQVGVKKLIQHVNVEDWLANLTPAQRRRVKRLLEEEPPTTK